MKPAIHKCTKLNDVQLTLTIHIETVPIINQPDLISLFSILHSICVSRPTFTDHGNKNNAKVKLNLYGYNTGTAYQNQNFYWGFD